MYYTGITQSKDQQFSMGIGPQYLFISPSCMSTDFQLFCRYLKNCDFLDKSDSWRQMPNTVRLLRLKIQLSWKSQWYLSFRQFSKTNEFQNTPLIAALSVSASIVIIWKEGPSWPQRQRNWGSSTERYSTSRQNTGWTCRAQVRPHAPRAPHH